MSCILDPILQSLKNSRSDKTIWSLDIYVFQNIFKYLSMEDMINCLEVHPRMREYANFSNLWKVNCDKYGIEDEGETTQLAGGEDLCRHARMWIAFRNSPAYKLGTNSWNFKETYKVSLKGVVYRKVNFLFNKRSCVSKLIVLSRPDKLYHLNPVIKIASYLALNENFIVVSHNNAVIVYKFEGNQANFYFAVKLEDNSLVSCGCDKDSFVKDPFGWTTRIDVFFVKDENQIVLQIDEFNTWSKFWIDLKTKTITPMNYDGYIINVTKKYVIVDMHYKSVYYKISHKTRVYDHGSKVGRDIPGVLCDFQANETVLMGFEPSTSRVKVWDLKTAIQLPLNDYTHISILDPIKEIVYVVYHSFVQAYSVRTGKTIWKKSCSEGKLVYNAKLLCSRYLLVSFMSYGSSQKTIVRILDTKTGRHLYDITISMPVNMKLYHDVICFAPVLLNKLYTIPLYPDTINK